MAKILFLVILIISSLIIASNFTTITQNDFDNGAYSNTYYNTSTLTVELNQTYNNGTYASKVFDATSNSTWDSISWTQGVCYGCPLPNNLGTDASSNALSVNMTNNTLLLHLDEASGTIVDNSGNGNNGTASNLNYSQTGVFSTGIRFNGSNSNITTNTNVDNGFPSGLTFSMWVYHSSNTEDGLLSNVASGGGLYVYANANKAIWWGVRDADGTYVQYQSPNNVIQLNTWYHVAGTFTFNGQRNPNSACPGIKLYINGSLITNTQGGGCGFTTCSNCYDGYKESTAAFLIGTYSTFGSWNGTIDEVATWNRTLSASEIADLYKRGTTALNLSVRSCDDASCDTEPWTSVASNSPYTLAESSNQYFQYKFNFNASNSTFTPTLYNLSLSYTEIPVSPPPDVAVPEWNNISLILVLIVTITTFLVMRKP